MARPLQRTPQAIPPAASFDEVSMSIDAILIAPAQLAALQAAEPVVVIDTRDADTFAAGHIPGAVNFE